MADNNASQADGVTLEAPRRADGALEGLSVLDLTRARAGPTCVRQLADWGAKVIKIEAPGDGEDFSARENSDFQNLHRNKESLTLNLKKPEGVEILKRLVAQADVLVENFRPSVKFRLGIDYESLRPLNPKLIYVSISGFGQSGPYRDRPGLDQITQGMSGLMSVTGEPGRGPMRTGIAVSDMAAGLFAACGTLTALLERQRSGEGQWVCTSLLEAQIFMLDFQAARWLAAGELAQQAGNDHPTAAPLGCFRTKDGYINIAPMPSAWARLCSILQIDHVANDPDFVTAAARLLNRAQVNEIIQAAIEKECSCKWIEVLNQAGIPCGPVYRIDETFADEQVQHLGIAQNVASRRFGVQTLVGQPITMSRSRASLSSASPDQGEHTDQTLGALGYSAEEISALRKNGVI